MRVKRELRRAYISLLQLAYRSYKKLISAERVRVFMYMSKSCNLFNYKLRLKTLICNYNEN